GVISERYRDRHVDADHADIDPRRKLTCGLAVRSVDGDAVAILVLRGETDRLIERLGADDLQYRAEDLVLVGLRIGTHTVEKDRAHEETLLIALKLEAALVDERFGPFLLAHVHVVEDALAVGRRDKRSIVGVGIGRKANAQRLDLWNKLLEQH